MAFFYFRIKGYINDSCIDFTSLKEIFFLPKNPIRNLEVLIFNVFVCFSPTKATLFDKYEIVGSLYNIKKRF